MTDEISGRRRIVVIANRTCPCPALADDVAGRASAVETDVLVVAPALNSRLRHWLSDVDGAVALARRRLELAIAALGERGVRARGEVGDADPLVAIDDALAGFAADEIVIATLPPGRSNWIERGLVERARARYGVPIAHLVAGYEVAEEDARHAPARAAA